MPVEDVETLHATSNMINQDILIQRIYSLFCI